jgi:formate dehydrogenase alpha subunit
MTNSIEDIREAEAIFVIGSNTTEAHPIVALAVKEAVFNGADLIVADPRRIELSEFASMWLRQKPGTDIALINSLAHVILKEKLHDRDFIKKRTEGFEEYKKVLEKYSPEKVEKIVGIPADDIRKAARMFACRKKGVVIYAMGITQHVRGTDNVMALANFVMLTGNVGKPGTGLSPLRGQNNVQGACDMAALPNVLPGYAGVNDSKKRKAFEKKWGCLLSSEAGLSVVKMMEAAEKGELKAMFIMGENPVLSDPNLKHVEKALKNLDFLVVQDIFLSETAEFADVILPGASFAEKDGTFTSTERRVQRIRKAVKPPGEARADWEIIVDLANRLAANWRYESPKQVMEEINELVPAYGGITYERLIRNGLQWACFHPEHPGTRCLYEDEFARGKGQFVPVEYLPPSEVQDEEYSFLLIIGRSLFQYHTGTMTRRSKGLNTLFPRGYVEINPQDAEELSLKSGDEVVLESRRGKVKVSVELSERVAPKTLFSTFHFKEVPVNVLTSSELDEKSGIPELKGTPVKITKVTKRKS